MKLKTTIAIAATAALVALASIVPANAETSTPEERDFYGDAYAVCLADLRSWGDDDKTAASATPETTTLVRLSEVHAVMYGTTPVGTWICTMMISEGHPDGPYTESLPLHEEVGA